MLWVFLIISQYFIFLQSLLFPLISGLFKPLVPLRFASALATREREKREEKREYLAYSIAFSYCQSTLP